LCTVFVKKHCNGVQSRSEWNKAEDEGKKKEIKERNGMYSPRRSPVRTPAVERNRDQ
jgi:hypothetical protein